MPATGYPELRSLLTNFLDSSVLISSVIIKFDNARYKKGELNFLKSLTIDFYSFRKSCPGGKYVTKLGWYSKHMYGLIDVKIECGSQFSTRLTDDISGNGDTATECPEGFIEIQGREQTNYGIINARAKCKGSPSWSISNPNLQGKWEPSLSCPTGSRMTGIEVREQGCCGIINFLIICTSF